MALPQAMVSEDRGPSWWIQLTLLCRIHGGVDSAIGVLSHVVAEGLIHRSLGQRPRRHAGRR